MIICGTVTNVCCGVTARQAYERGFYVVFGSDVTATDDSELHAAELKVLRKGFARVLTGVEIVGALSPGVTTGLPGHPPCSNSPHEVSPAGAY